MEWNAQKNSSRLCKKLLITTRHMEKVKFTAKVNMPKIGKNPTKVAMDGARASTKIKITISGTFTAGEAGVLELLLKSWHKDGKING